MIIHHHPQVWRMYGWPSVGLLGVHGWSFGPFKWGFPLTIWGRNQPGSFCVVAFLVKHKKKEIEVRHPQAPIRYVWSSILCFLVFLFATILLPFTVFRYFILHFIIFCTTSLQRFTTFYFLLNIVWLHFKYFSQLFVTFYYFNHILFTTFLLRFATFYFLFTTFLLKIASIHCLVLFPGVPWEPSRGSPSPPGSVPGRFRELFWVFEKVQKVGESQRKSEKARKSEKVRESRRKSEKVRESLRKSEKVRESLRKSEKVGEGSRKFEKVA